MSKLGSNIFLGTGFCKEALGITVLPNNKTRLLEELPIYTSDLQNGNCIQMSRSDAYFFILTSAAGLVFSPQIFTAKSVVTSRVEHHCAENTLCERRGTTAVSERPHSRRDKQRLWPTARSKTDTVSQLGQCTSRAALDV